jgi:hypothetical protein
LSVLLIEVILGKKSEKRPSKIYSRKKKKTICKRKINLSDEGAIVLFEEYNLLDDWSFYKKKCIRQDPFPSATPLL